MSPLLHRNSSTGRKMVLINLNIREKCICTFFDDYLYIFCCRCCWFCVIDFVVVVDIVSVVGVKVVSVVFVEVVSIVIEDVVSVVIVDVVVFSLLALLILLVLLSSILLVLSSCC